MKRVVLSVGLVVILALVFGALWSWRTARMPLPDYDRSSVVEGLANPVEILRDARGVAHIFAADRDDLMFGQGYVHAQDRWFTMELYRHVARGELSRLIGRNEDAIASDRLMHSLGTVALAERDLASLDARTRRSLDAFAAGVNAYIAGRSPRALAVEYSLLNIAGHDIDVRPWSAVDSLAVAKLMGFAMSGKDATREIERAALKRHLPLMMYAQWQPPYDHARHPTVLTLDELPVEHPGAAKPDNEAGQNNAGASPGEGEARPASGIRRPPHALMEGMDALNRLGFAADGAGSNSWVLSGERTVSGAPLLAVDPHNGIEMPNLWHEIGLHIRPLTGQGNEAGEGVSIYGFAAAPFFMVLDGRNDHAAWGTTNVTGGDALDLFELTLNPDNPDQYLWDGQWRDLVKSSVRIEVAASEPVSFETRRTHFGPVLPYADGETAYAVRWGGFEPSDLVRAALDMPFSRTFAQFQEALRGWDFPPTHFTFAARTGEIGIQQAGRFPVRAPDADGSVPQDGSRSDAHWAVYIPYDAMPYASDPDDGIIATSNNPVVPAAFFDRLDARTGGLTDYLRDAARGYRAVRVEALLKTRPRHDVESTQSIQTDVTVPGLRAALQPVLDATAARSSACRSALEAWDGAFTQDSTGALIFARFWTETLDRVYAPHLPDGTRPRVGMTELLSLETILADPNSGWWDDPTTQGREGRDDRLPGLLDAACAALAVEHGDAPTAWRWGDVHGAQFRNEVVDGSGIHLLQRFGNRGPIPVPGGAATVNVARWRHGQGFAPVHIAGYRMIVDLTQPDLVFVANSTGQSSHPASPHYADGMEGWAQGRYEAVRVDEASVRARAVHALTLRPQIQP
ncbi:MAG: penicillin acylase family protein [Pseudomonadota bacterium]